MRIHSYHLAGVGLATTVKAFGRPLTPVNTAGLRHAECMAAMTLGAPVFSQERIRLNQLAVFASWESESALDAFLAKTELGRILSTGWHVRLEFLRRWGHFPEFDDPSTSEVENDPNQPVVAVTLARLRLPQVLRFVRWGKPVEEQVRDHPATVMAHAAMRPLRTFSTFSVWRSQKEMLDMVHGHGHGHGTSSESRRHAEAMRERDRKDFHHQFATFRFRSGFGARGVGGQEKYCAEIKRATAGYPLKLTDIIPQKTIPL